jgi:hypothetical protein
MDHVAVGSDVHAIGHPTGEAWTYTRGIVSQIRRSYEWSVGPGPTHRADVIQTQTPINPGNSGGPLLDDEGKLIGVNSFKSQGEGLNFAVTVDEVRRLLTLTSDRLYSGSTAAGTVQPNCVPKEVKKGRSADGRATEVVYDVDCDGQPDAILTRPDDPTSPATLAVDTTGQGTIDTVYIDRDRDGKWDVSLYDTDRDGKPDLVGYHRGGDWKPYRFENYAASR